MDWPFADREPPAARRARLKAARRRERTFCAGIAALLAIAALYVLHGPGMRRHVITPEHLRAADAAAIAAMDAGQLQALRNLVEATSPMVSTEPAFQARLGRIYRREADKLNAQLTPPGAT